MYILLYNRYSIKEILVYREQLMLRSFENSFTITKSVRQIDDQHEDFRKSPYSHSVGQVSDDHSSLMQLHKSIRFQQNMNYFSIPYVFSSQTNNL